MSIISRYLAVSFFKIWALALAGFLVLYTAIDFLEKIGDFVGKSIALKTILLFFLAQLPKVVTLMAPVATLVAVMITLTVLARASEIVAFKAGGVSLYRLSAPILASAAVISLAMFFLSDLVAPKTTALANSIWQGQVRERLDTSTVVRDVWLKGVRLIQHYGAYDEADGRVREVTLIFTDDEMRLARRLEAARGLFSGGQLRLSEVKEKIYQQDERSGARAFTLKRHELYVLEDWPAPPPGFGRADQNSDELSVAQLWRTIDRLQEEGFGPVRQRVDLHFKFSFALLPIIMVVVGLPIGFWREKGGSIALGLAAGLILSFFYLISMELARSLGYSGLLPPLAAAWLPSLIYFLFGAYFFSYVRQ
ncbi:MAG: LPS export ABC transporter permease LptG [Candidatus Adiutrix sp.]|jgi:lipopolysaccharide export system permease protein|nr:LPS export ABC transporter permease LptG [Candidatus Adiutrix sp.]